MRNLKMPLLFLIILVDLVTFGQGTNFVISIQVPKPSPWLLSEAPGRIYSSVIKLTQNNERSYALCTKNQGWTRFTKATLTLLNYKHV